MGVIVRVDGIGILVVLFIMWVVVPAIVAYVLYLIVRLGVKHGLRAHDAARNEGPSPTE